MNNLLLMVRASQSLLKKEGKVKLVEYYGYREGRVFKRSGEGSFAINLSDSRWRNSRAYFWAERLHENLAYMAKRKKDNWSIAVFDFDGKVITIQWFDHGVMIVVSNVSRARKIKPMP